MKQLVITSIIIAAVVGGVAQAAGSGVECPINRLSDGVEDALKAAPSCKAAVNLFWACGTGGSRDAARLQMVTQKCEPDYRAKPLRLAAEREIKTCWRKAAEGIGTEGSAYRSWAAYCAASVHDRYSGRALRDKRLSPDKRSKAQPPPGFGRLRLLSSVIISRA